MKTLHILYFARLRETLGCGEETVSLPDSVTTVADLTAWLALRGGAWAEELGGQRVFRVAVNQEMVQATDLLPTQAEVAIFPPVTGG